MTICLSNSELESFLEKAKIPYANFKHIVAFVHLLDLFRITSVEVQ